MLGTRGSAPRRPHDEERGVRLPISDDYEQWLVVGGRKGMAGFDAADVQLLEAIGAIGASALENAHLVEPDPPSSHSRPPHEPPQPAALRRPRQPGRAASSPAPGEARRAHDRPRRLPEGQREPRPRDGQRAVEARRRAAHRRGPRSRHGRAHERRRLHDPAAGHRRRRGAAASWPSSCSAQSAGRS